MPVSACLIGRTAAALLSKLYDQLQGDLPLLAERRALAAPLATVDHLRTSLQRLLPNARVATSFLCG